MASTAKLVVFGFLLSGTGKVWGDDFRLLVDGRPAAEAPDRPQTAIDTDHEFDGGSRVNLTALSATQVANLAKLAKVWGFLKYHHPAVTAGQRHWDYELFRILPRVLAAADGVAANQAISAWIAGLGAVAACTRCAGVDTTLQYMAASLDWLADEALLGKELSQTLQAVYRNRNIASKTFYVSQAADAGNPIFENEPAYPNLKLPDSGYQLLALFRYWNMVQYFYPYRDVMADDPAQARTYWDGVLRDCVKNVARTRDYERGHLAKILAGNCLRFYGPRLQERFPGYTAS